MRESRVMRTRRTRIAAATFLATCSVVSFCSCGGGGTYTPTTPVVTQPPAPVQTVVAQGAFSLYAPANGLSYFLYSDFTTTKAGDLEATVDWTDAKDELWMYISEGVCTADQFETDACPGPDCPCRFSVSSEAATPKPRVLKVPNASAGARTLIVWSLRPKEDAVSYQVVLTAPGASAAAGPGSQPTTMQMAAKRAGHLGGN